MFVSWFMYITVRWNDYLGIENEHKVPNKIFTADKIVEIRIRKYMYLMAPNVPIS